MSTSNLFRYEISVPGAKPAQLQSQKSIEDLRDFMAKRLAHLATLCTYSVSEDGRDQLLDCPDPNAVFREHMWNSKEYSNLLIINVYSRKNWEVLDNNSRQGMRRALLDLSKVYNDRAMALDGVVETSISWIVKVDSPIRGKKEQVVTQDTQPSAQSHKSANNKPLTWSDTFKQVSGILKGVEASIAEGKARA